MKRLKAVAIFAFGLTALAVSGLSYADAGRKLETPRPAAQCDASSFSNLGSANRANCRRVFAREGRPSVQTEPQRAEDHAS